MIFAAIINALAVSPNARVDQRVPKKLLLEQDVPTAADKRQIQDGIEDMRWIAALKPNNIGVPEFRDNLREYLEIAVLTVSFRHSAKPARLIELIHRAIPYPLVLLSSQSDKVSLSLAHKRWSQGEAGKVVIEDLRKTAAIDLNALAEPEAQFLSSLALSTLPAADLFVLYQAWIDRLAGLEAASITGSFTPPTSAEHSTTLRDGLANHARLQYELTTLCNQAAKEKQLNRRVEINMTIKRLEVELAELKTTLSP
jgi:hypothetical protein